ncbi:recombinase family protein [Pseudomonas syringae pv. syringae]|uniref:recombinase family protein n=2 Tax=Pseudomonas TaxID=286 RepID=UPI000CF0CB68|nr:recombinase family protein [Pseudomonas syringae]MCF5199291.1 recombinase family protein [Pseudomonas syringae]MCF5207728.1 recombinase family protein [Pseudomonas syringae]MCF5215991.1 recombinase family protein [Pseudomonas syringae]MCF5217343.1 recombinase family protein [Pseudomonas syringae]MCF5268483.1 recombinase family protein [Pseudomonas syringae]
MVGSNCPRTIHGSAQAASALAPYSYLSSPHGRMLATFLSGIAEFERYLICERIKSGLAAARARGRKLGSQAGVRPKSDKLDPKVMDAIEACRSYRWIARDLGISKNTVTEIVRRHRETA